MATPIESVRKSWSDAAGAAFPATAWVPEVTYQFALLSIDANDGQITALQAVARVGEVFELEVSMGAVAGGDLFVVHAQRIAHVVEQSCDGIVADPDGGRAEFLRDSDRGAAAWTLRFTASRRRT